MTNRTQSSQVALFSVLNAPMDAVRTQTSQLAMFSVVDFRIAAAYAKVPQLALFAPVSASGIPKTSQLAMFVVFNEGAREDNTLRAWGFILDGHSFYVLHLGMLGTYVCDVTSGFQWSQWQTEGMESWNAEQGLMWQDMVVAGDNQNPILWQINPETQLDDEFKPIRRTATALIPARGRKTVTLDMFSINASAGYPTADNPELTLSFSDDNGNTWVTMPAITLESGAFDQNLQFGSLGTFGQPGRIINVSDVGGMVRLSDIDVEMGGNDPWEA